MGASFGVANGGVVKKGELIWKSKERLILV